MRLLAVLLLAGLLAQPVVAAPWLQFGHDAARTGARPDPGPAADDVAFMLQLPDSRADGATPIIIGRHAYVLTTDCGVASLDAKARFRIALDTAGADVLI